MDVRRLLGRLREVLDWRVVALGVVLFVGVLAVSALLFLAIPRFQLESGMFLDRLITKKARTGFSDTIRFGDVTEIQQDTSVALNVDVSDQSQIPASPYWRMLVLDAYENGAFRFSPLFQTIEMERERSSSSLSGRARPQRPEPVSWTFYLESGVSRYLPLLGHFEQLRFRDPQNFRYAPRLSVLALREEPVTMVAYRVEGFDMAPSLPDATFAREFREHETTPRPRVAAHLRLPRFPRETDLTLLNRMVAEATGGAQLSAAEFAQQVGEWLKRNHNYSLSPNIPGTNGDPLVRWLSSRESGHCELFAGSFVLLARAAGFPARMVTGFRGGSWNGYSNNFTIRNADAHAWAELFDVTTSAWLRADPLAVATGTQVEEARGAAAVASRMDRSWNARFDSLRVFWYRRIVSFDQQSQVETLKAMKEMTQSSGKAIRQVLAEKVASMKAWLASPWSVRRVVSIAGALAIIGAALWSWREFGRDWWRNARRRTGGGRLDPTRREAGRWLRRFADLSAARGEWSEVHADLQRLRYGARHTWPPAEKVFRRARRAWRDARRLQKTTRS